MICLVNNPGLMGHIQDASFHMLKSQIIWKLVLKFNKAKFQPKSRIQSISFLASGELPTLAKNQIP
jgi:hypothetical protein